MSENKSSEKTSGRYEMIKQLEGSLWTYGSPIIIRSGVLERDVVSQKNRLTLKFTNIYQQEIKDVYLKVIAKDSAGNKEVIEHAYKSLAQKYLATKGVFKLAIPNENADQFDVIIDKVVFEDMRVWQKDNAKLDVIDAVTSEDLEEFAQTHLDEYEEIYKFGRTKLQSDETADIAEGIKQLEKVRWYMDAHELLDNGYKKYEAAKHTAARKMRGVKARETRNAIVKKRIKIAFVTVIALVVLSVVAVLAFFIPNSKYQNAVNVLSKANAAKEQAVNSNKPFKKDGFEEAAKKFASLKGFRKSEDYEAESYYNVGLYFIANKNEIQAKDYFNKSYKAAADSDFGKMAGAFLDYYKGEEALKNNDIENALKLFSKSADAASDFDLINKASEGVAHVSYLKKEYKSAWDAIKNVYAKDKSYEKEYGQYGYAYAKFLIDNKKVDEGIEIYNTIAKYTKGANLNDSIYAQAVKLAEKGNIAKSMDLLYKIKKKYPKASTLYEKEYAFHQRIKGWLGLWKHHGKFKGKKKTYRIYISEVLYKGEMCFKIKDKNNDQLGFETVISKKNHVTQIVAGSYMIHFKLKRYQDQKFTYALTEPNKMKRTWKYGKEKFVTKYKKKIK